MSTEKLSNISLVDYELFLEKVGCKNHGLKEDIGIGPAKTSIGL
jgi:hypothetical protein